MVKERSSILGRLPLFVVAATNPVGMAALAGTYIVTKAAAKVIVQKSLQDTLVDDYQAALEAAEANPDDPNALAWQLKCEQLDRSKMDRASDAWAAGLGWGLLGLVLTILALL